MCYKSACYVGFDTSNYTTSAAVCTELGEIAANLKVPLPVKEGEVGLRQSEAVFAHIKNLPKLCEMLDAVLGAYEIKAVGVSSAPRDADGSYMPCFLSGVAAASAFAAGRNIPIIKTSHQNGHIMAALYSAGVSEKLLGKPFLAFHLSGGTTEALLVNTSADGKDFSVRIVGGTRDINAGQAIDRVGVMMGLGFPCGRELEELAAAYIGGDGRLEKKRITVSDGYCNLSGVENLAKRIYDETQSREKTAAFVFDFLCRNIVKMTEQLKEKYGEMPVLFSGGVMSNKLMRASISSCCEAYFAEPEFSADNAAGVALLCRAKYLN